MCTFSCRSQDADVAGRNLVTAVSSLLPLPCGGYGISSSALPLSSVYQAAGPVLYNVTITASHTTVVEGQTVELVATVHSMASLMMPLGKLLPLLVSITLLHLHSDRFVCQLLYLDGFCILDGVTN